MRYGGIMQMSKRIAKTIMVIVPGMLLISGCAPSYVSFDFSSPVVSDGTVIVKGACDIVAVDKETGTVKWRIEKTEAKKLDFCQPRE